jgi:Zn-dependent protease
MDIDLNFVRAGLIMFLLLVGSLTIHEWAHAITADLLGDDTPRSQGRVTLNPLAHIDFIGTIIIPLINIFIFHGLAIFGWGKPVLTRPSNFKHPKRDDILTCLAGPASNLLLALLAVLLGDAIVLREPRFAELLGGLILMNVGLALFNLLPLPPLDGGYVMRHVTGMSEAGFLRMSRWSGIIMLIAFLIPEVRAVFGLVFYIACRPYVSLCAWINPIAAQLLFPGFG